MMSNENVHGQAQSTVANIAAMDHPYPYPHYVTYDNGQGQDPKQKLPPIAQRSNYPHFVTFDIGQGQGPEQELPPTVQRSNYPRSVTMDIAHVADIRLAVQTLNRAEINRVLDELNDQQLRDLLFDRSICYPNDDHTKRMRGWFVTKMNKHQATRAFRPEVVAELCIAKLGQEWYTITMDRDDLNYFANTWFMHNIAIDVDRLGVHGSSARIFATKRDSMMGIYKIAFTVLTLPFLANGTGSVVFRYDPFSRAICLIRASAPGKARQDEIMSGGVKESFDDIIRRANAIGLFPGLASALYANPVPKVLGYGEPFTEIPIPVTRGRKKTGGDNMPANKRPRVANEADEDQSFTDRSQVQGSFASPSGSTYTTGRLLPPAEISPSSQFQMANADTVASLDGASTPPSFNSAQPVGAAYTHKGFSPEVKQEYGSTSFEQGPIFGLGPASEHGHVTHSQSSSTPQFVPNTHSPVQNGPGYSQSSQQHQPRNTSYIKTEDMGTQQDGNMVQARALDQSRGQTYESYIKHGLPSAAQHRNASSASARGDEAEVGTVIVHGGGVWRLDAERKWVPVAPGTSGFPIDKSATHGGASTQNIQDFKSHDTPEPSSVNVAAPPVSGAQPMGLQDGFETHAPPAPAQLQSPAIFCKEEVSLKDEDVDSLDELFDDGSFPTGRKGLDITAPGVSVPAYSACPQNGSEPGFSNDDKTKAEVHLDDHKGSFEGKIDPILSEHRTNDVKHAVDTSLTRSPVIKTETQHQQTAYQPKIPDYDDILDDVTKVLFQSAHAEKSTEHQQIQAPLVARHVEGAAGLIVQRAKQEFRYPMDCELQFRIIQRSLFALIWVYENCVIDQAGSVVSAQVAQVLNRQTVVGCFLQITQLLNYRTTHRLVSLQPLRVPFLASLALVC